MAQDKKSSDEILKELFNSINDIVPSSEGSDEGSDVEKKLVVKKEKKSKSSYDSSYSSKSKHKKKKKSKKSSTKYSLHFSSEKSKKSSSDRKSSSKSQSESHSSGVKTEKGEKLKVKTEKEMPLIEVLKKEVIEKEAQAVMGPPEIELPPLRFIGDIKVKQEKLDLTVKEEKTSRDDKEMPSSPSDTKVADDKKAAEEDVAPKIADVFMEDLMESGAKNLPYGPAEKPKKTIQINLKTSSVLDEAAKAATEKNQKRKHEGGELSDTNLSDVSSTSDISGEGGDAADGSSKDRNKGRSKEEKERRRKKKKSKHSHKDRKDDERERRRAERALRRSKDEENRGSRSSRRRSRSRSLTSSDLRHRSSSRHMDRARREHRRNSRSRSRDRSSKKSRSPSRDRSRRSKSSLDRDEHRSKRRRSRGRSSRSRSRDRGKSRHKDKDKDEYRIDKGKLLEIARKNALKMLNQGQVGSDPNKVVTITAGGKTVDELTDFCKHLSQKEASGLDSVSSESSSDESEAGGKAFHHPFKLKERPSQIIMNIRNMPPLPVKSHQELATENLRLQFPVSSGQHHRKTESEWVPVSHKRTDPSPSTSKPKKDSGPKAIEAPPLPTPEPAAAPIYPTVYPNPSDRRPIDIGAVISERLAAIRNETDASSSSVYSTGFSGWGDSSATGVFTGSTGARILTPNELASGQQAWAKKKTSRSLEEGEASSSSSSDSFSMSEISSDEEAAVPDKPLPKVLPLSPPILPEPPMTLQKPPLALPQPPLALSQPPLVIPHLPLLMPPAVLPVVQEPLRLPPPVAAMPPIVLPDVTRPPPPIEKKWILSDKFCRKFGGASSELPDLLIGQRVIVTDMKMSGTVLTKIDAYTYLVQTDQGKLKCDRFYLVPLR